MSEKHSKDEVEYQLKFVAKFVEGEIAKNQGCLVGGRLSEADIMLLLPPNKTLMCGFATREDFPHIAKFVDTLTAWESYSAAKEKTNANGESFRQPGVETLASFKIKHMD